MKLSGTDIAGISWFDDNPDRKQREIESMLSVAPELSWSDSIGSGGGWTGTIPRWPFERPMPPALSGVELAALQVVITCFESHPAVPPAIFPIDPEPSADRRTQHVWHLNGDGSLCLLRLPDLWDERCLTTELVMKASAWYLEYLLLEAHLIESMTEAGIASSDELDAILSALFAQGST